MLLLAISFALDPAVEGRRPPRARRSRCSSSGRCRSSSSAACSAAGSRAPGSPSSSCGCARPRRSTRRRRRCGRRCATRSSCSACGCRSAATYVGTDGSRFLVPEEDVARVSTLVAGEDGVPVAVLVHDRTLLDEPELLEAVAAAARLSLERNRLLAELRARLDELQRERDFIASAVNASPAFFGVIDLDGGVLRFNDALVESERGSRRRGRPRPPVLGGVPRAATMRRTRTRRRARRGAGRARAPLAHARRGRGVRRLVAGRRSRTARGRPRLLFTGLDVSERVRHEDELRRERDFLTSVSRATPSLLCAVHRPTARSTGAASTRPSPRRRGSTTRARSAGSSGSSSSRRSMVSAVREAFRLRGRHRRPR